MTNPLARLVGELPNLREPVVTPEMVGALLDLDPKGDWRFLVEKWTPMIRRMLAASPSAHAIAIEAIERLERVEKALTANVTFEEDNGSDEFTDGYWSGVAALRKAIGAALAASKGGTHKHDWVEALGTHGLIDRCQICGEERA